MDASSTKETTMAVVKGPSRDAYFIPIKFTEAMVTYAQITWHWINQWFPWITSREMTSQILISLWNRLRIWTILREKCFFLKKREQYQLLQWVQQMINSPNVTNFKEDWRDGIVLCALLEALIPGSCPRHDLLHPKQEILNIELGLKLANMHLGIQSDMNPTDIANMVEGIENRMVCFITRLRARHTIGPQLRRICLKSRMEDTPMHHPACYARGMGLLIGVKGSKAYFNIYFPANQLMDIVIEIDGPNGEYYTERITVRSPRRKECHSNTSETFTMDFKNELTSGRVINIPVEYEIFPRKIAVNYTPPSSGRYHLSLISRGQHIFGSPFKVMVDNESSSAVVSQRKFLGTGILRNDSNRNLFDLDNCDLQLMTPLDDQLNGIIIKKKLLKTIVFRQYADIVLLGDEALPQDPRAWMSTSVSSDNDSNFLDWSSVLNDSMTTCKSDEVLNNFDMPTTKSPDSIQLHEISYEQLHSEENEEHNIMDDLEHESNANVSEEKLSEDDDDDDKYSSKSTIPIYEFQNDENSDHLQQSHIANVDEPDMPLSFLSQDLKTDTTSVTSEDNENSENNDILINRGNDIYSLSEVSNGSLNDNTKSPFTDGVKGISAELNRLYKSYQPKMSENGFRSRNDNIINQMSKIDFDEPVSMHVTTSTRVTPDTVCPPRTKCTSFGGHVGGGISARVPEALINDWVDLWNHDGEGIVTNLVRQYEQILNSYKDGRPSPSLNHTDSE